MDRDRRRCLNELTDISTRLGGSRNGGKVRSLGIGVSGKEWLTASEAATIYGRGKRALQSFLRRERERPDGSSVRRRDGAVQKTDFPALLEMKGRAGAARSGAARRAAGGAGPLLGSPALPVSTASVR